MIKIDSSWTLFLDRDGVINERIPGQYISDTADFIFTEGCLSAITSFSKIFSKIVVVTNQQGIGKEIMTEEQLLEVHRYMISEIKFNGGRIDAVYFCPKLAKESSDCRKPNIGMGLQAQSEFSSINFKKSIMVGDSISDIEFGNRLDMKTVFVEGKIEEITLSNNINVDYRISKLVDLQKILDY